MSRQKKYMRAEPTDLDRRIVGLQAALDFHLADIRDRQQPRITELEQQVKERDAMIARLRERLGY